MRPTLRHGISLLLAAALLPAGSAAALAAGPVRLGLLDRIEAARSRGEIDRGKAEFYKLASLYAPDKIPARLREPPAGTGDDSPLLRCGTLVRRAARKSLPLMDAADRAEAEALLALPVTAPEETAAARALGKTAVHVGTAWAETENFSIEWDATLTNEDGSLPPRDDDADGVPDVAELWASYFEQSYALIVGDMGYTDPLFSVYKVTVYVHDLSLYGFGVYGITNEPTQTHPMPVIEVNRNFSFAPPNGDANDLHGAMKVTAAHEFFHVHHFLYEPAVWEWYEDDWWMENSSTWMEDEVFDHVDDYYQFYTNSAWASLLGEGIPVDKNIYDPTWNTRAYGGAVFAKYFQQHAGGRDAMRDVWTLVRSGRRILDGPWCTAWNSSDICTAWESQRRDGAVTDFAQGLAGIGWSGEEDIHLGYSAANVAHDYDEGIYFGEPSVSYPIAINPPGTTVPGPKHLGSHYRWSGGGGLGLAVTLSPDVPGSWGLALAVDRQAGYSLTIAGRQTGAEVVEQVDVAGAGDAVYAALNRYVPGDAALSYAVSANTADPAGAAPGAVTGLAATPVVGGLRLSWTLPDPPSSVEGVVVRFRKTGDAAWQSRTLWGPWTVAEIGGLVEPGAEIAQPHEVEVFAYDARGNEGPVGPEATLPSETPGIAYPADPAPAAIISTGSPPPPGGGGGGGCFLDALGL